ncbi:HD domain-containing protein [bacterium]|nr:HD domain-containing protein [bacterium]
MTGVAGLPTTDTQKLRLLLNVSRLIASRLELKPLIEEVVRQASRLVSADRSTLWLYDHGSNEIYTFLGEGLNQEIRMPLGKGVAGAAALERREIVIDDAYSSPYFNPEVDRQTGYLTRSLLAVPMESHDRQLLGCFQAVNRLDDTAPDGIGAFSEEDIDVLTALAGVAAVAVENALLYAEQKRMFNSFIVTLAQSVDAKDPTTSNHTMMVTGIAVAIAQYMGLSHERVERVRIAAVLHDYGKIGVPDDVLNKRGKLEDMEFMQMRSHCIKTILILSRIAFGRGLEDIPRIAGLHHEKLDGLGYPFGLKAEEIPLESRILAVADVFQALIQTRPYKQGLPPDQALEECWVMTRWHRDRFGRESGPHLDANVVNALGEILEANRGQLEFFEKMSGWDLMLAGEDL